MSIFSVCKRKSDQRPKHAFSDMEAVATVIRITRGNFRLIHRLCTQIERILHINEIRMVTKEVVEAAREQLVIGQV